MDGRINDGLVRWACVYAAQRWLCAGAIFAVLFWLSSAIFGELIKEEWKERIRGDSRKYIMLQKGH